MRKPLTLTQVGSVATVTLARPPRNLLDAEMFRSLAETVAKVAGEDTVRVLVVTGGEEAFSEGIDVDSFRALTPGAKEEFVRLGRATMMGLERLQKPTIAAMAGKVLGAGLELALSCDMRVASEDAQFGHPEVLQGLVPMFGGSLRLEKLIGMSRARALIFFGEPIPAWEALEMGLVGKVTPKDSLLEEAGIAASRIALHPVDALRTAKTMLIKGETDGVDADLDDVLDAIRGDRTRGEEPARKRRSANRE